ncbi:ribosomal-processing cysteine protease Prp [Vagococcus sp.]|uniref:ribosomal-processing cysteine protease Prp n=1 Tax=Vagococcus sp. TaxID=1933889 RepID=UPI003F94B5B6
MIEASFKKRAEDFLSFELSGHAGSGPYGFDIVCAACSVLAINTVNSIEEIAHFTPLVDVEDGYLFMTFPDDIDEKQFEITQLLIRSLEIGLDSIAEEYPKFVKIS